MKRLRFAKIINAPVAGVNRFLRREWEFIDGQPQRQQLLTEREVFEDEILAGVNRIQETTEYVSG